MRFNKEVFLTKTTQNFLKGAMYGFGLLLMLSWAYLAKTEVDFLSFPRTPDPSAHRSYPYQVKGLVVYLSHDELEKVLLGHKLFMAGFYGLLFSAIPLQAMRKTAKEREELFKP